MLPGAANGTSGHGPALRAFVREYQVVRRAEGWGDRDPAYYRALPWHDVSGRHTDLWRVRAATFRAFVTNVLRPLEVARGTALWALDLGAGNGWLAYRLAQRGHHAAAVDLLDDTRDGLGARRAYDLPLLAVQAEFDHLPLAAHQFDLAIFNASLHYSPAYETTLAEALRVLKPDGQIAVLDSPVYSSRRAGARMVLERRHAFQQKFGFGSDALGSEHYLTPPRLQQVGERLGIHWTRLRPAYGWRWITRRWLARLRARREPAHFELLVGTRVA